MGRFQQLAIQVSQLPIDRQDVIAGVIERAFDRDLYPKSLLSDAELEELRIILSEPIDIASDEEVEAAFADWGN